jgi:Domain of Unknown Function (DUF928)
MRAYRLRPGSGWRALGVIALVGHFALTGAFAAEQKAAPETGSPASNPALGGIVYAPPTDFGAPEVTESGGVRGLSQADAKLPKVFLLAPPTLARTLSAQPTLYWYVSDQSTAPLRLTMLDLETSSPEPLLEVNLGPVPAAGVYGASLAAHDLRLEAGHRYEWSVALQVNPEDYSEEPVAKTILAAGLPDSALLAKLEGASALSRAETLAAAGYWYDTLDLLGQRIAAKDPSQPWRQLRAGLLEKVGLEMPAAFDRAGGAQ